MAREGVSGWTWQGSLVCSLMVWWQQTGHLPVTVPQGLPSEQAQGGRSGTRSQALPSLCAMPSRAILQQQGSPVDATIAALVCTSVVNPQSMGLGGGVIFTIYNATTGASTRGPQGEDGLVHKHRCLAEPVPSAHALPGSSRCPCCLPTPASPSWQVLS